MELTFWGATDDVTGSMTFLHTGSGYILIDCGLAQGDNDSEKINKLIPPIESSTIEAIIITHAHLDHTGFIPRMVKKGFRGRIYCTPPTSKLMQIILMDSAKLNKEDNFYDSKDVNISIPLVQTYEWNEVFEIAGAKLHFIPAGHILGASCLVVEKDDKKIVFSGDLGRFDDPILHPHPYCPEADVVVMESTYGNRVRESSLHEDLEKFLKKVATEKRIGIIASFAVARGQTLLTLIHQFHQEYPEYKVRVVMDSPMMKAANNVYKRYRDLTLYSEDVYDALSDIDAIEFQKEWESLRKKEGPLIIVSSSGMLTGGRIGRYLLNWHNDTKAILLLAGYQGADTPGRSLLAGSRTLVGPDDEVFEWNGEIWHSDAFSSHADQGELLEWVMPSQAKKVFLLHGESSAKEILKGKIKEAGIKEVIIPARGEKFKI
ncbi:MAG TPA: MBL fold metallo-hydrolase [Bacteriovoracaceae bacterium]|nr:MBL fold metallo-hydrolase [Bacteriovoracaceae bacterium]